MKEIHVPKFINKIESKLDRTVKYVFSSPEIIECSYIDKQDGKDILCVPTQTSCNLGCKFCFLSDYKMKVRNLTADEIVQSIDYTIKDMELPKKNVVLLISFMGCGEPLLNLKNVISAMIILRKKYQKKYCIVRFAVATLVPKILPFKRLTEQVIKNNLQVKVHLSLHSPFQDIREKLMPGAFHIWDSLWWLEQYIERTGNSAEIHYSMIDGVNDKENDLKQLIQLFGTKKIPIKFLAYNEKPSIELKQSKRVEYFREELSKYGIVTEYYVPPGRDIGSSCGQFLMEYYLQYNKKRIVS